MSYASFGSTKLDPRVSAPEPEPEGQDSLGTSLRKGWSSGLDSLGANANQLAGLVGEAAGADGFAKNRYAAAKTLRESAEMGAPQISSLDQIDGVGNALRYGAGQLGALAPIALGVTGASLATGNPLVGGALAMGVPEAGDIAYRQTQDPGVAGMGAGERLARAGAGGLASGVVQSAGPGMLMSKFAAPGKELVRRSMPAIVGQNLASGVGVNAGASAGSEAIKQIATNTDAPLNTGAIGEAAAAGAVMGLPFGAAGAGVDLVRSSPGKSWIGAKGLAQDGVQAAKDGVQAAKDGVPSTEDLVSKLRDISKPAADMADSIMNSQTMSDAKEFAGKTTDQVSAALKERAGKTADLSVKLGNDLLGRSGLSDEHQATIREAMSNAGDTANQIKIATIAKSLKAKDYATEKVSKAYDKVSEAYKKLYPDNGVKKSEDYSGLENLIYEKVAPMIEDAKPEFLENPENINKLGGTLRMFLRAAADGKDLRVAGIHTSISDMLGHDLAHDVLNAAHEYATGTDQTKVSNMMKALSEQLRDKAGNESLTQIIKKSQSAEAPARTGVTDSPEQLAGIIRDWARGEYSKGKSRSQIEYHDEVMKQFLRQHFGTKADRVLAAAQKEVEGEAKRASGKTEARTDSDERTGDLSEKRNDASDSEYGTTNDREVKTFYHEGKDGENKLYEQSPETVSKHGSALEQALAKQREEHPNHKVHFVKLRDYAKAHDLDEAAMLKLTGGKDPGSYGFIKHDLIDGSDKLEPHQLRGMRGEIRSAIHPDAIGVEGRTIQYDSRRIANVMHESAKDEWSDMENAHGMRGRMAQKFAEGIAKLTEHEGANLKVRDDHVIARINGKDMTWGEAKEILKNPDTIKAPEHMKNASRAEQKLHDFIPELDDAHISRLMNEATFRRDGLTEPIKAEIEAAVKKEMGRAKYGSNKSDQVYREVQRRLKEATADEATGIPKLERVIRSLENEKDRRAGEDRRTSVMDTGMETREGIALNKGKMGVLESTQHTSDVRLDTLLGEKSGSAAQVADARTKSQAAQLGMTDLSGKVGKRGRDTGIGSGRMEGDPEGQIHDAVATVNRSDLERHTPSVGGRMADGKDLILKASKIRQTDSPMKEGLAKRLETLAVNMTMMTKEDQAALHAVMHLTSPVDLKAAIDPIARKYADRIAPPKGDIGGLMGPGDKRSTVKGKLADRSVQEGVARMDDITHQAFGVDDPGPMPMRETGSTPNPKAVAAKKAAFLERAASGDEGLIKEVSTSDDAKGLQRAVELLVTHVSPNKFDAFDFQRFGESFGAVTERNATRSGAGMFTSKNPELVADYKNLVKEKFGQAHEYDVKLKLKPDEILDLTKKLSEQPEVIQAKLRKELDATTPANGRSSEAWMQHPTSVALKALYDRTRDLKAVRETLTRMGIKATHFAEPDYKGVLRDGNYVVLHPDAVAGFAPKVLDAINARLSELVQDPQTALGMQTKKYSLLSTHNSAVDEIAVHGKVWNLGPNIRAVEATHAEEAYSNNKVAIEKGKVYFEMFDSNGDHTSGWLNSLDEVRQHAEQIGIESGEAVRAKTPSGDFDDSMMSHDATKATGTPLTAKGKAQIEKYIHDVLGDSVAVNFPFLPHAGEFANNVVSVSVHALNPTTVAYHESLHALFKQLKDKGLDGANKVVEQAASKPAVTARLRELLAHSPDALAQLKDAEERAAYMYQFWANGDAKLIAAMGEKSTNLFTRITDALKKVMGIWTNDQHAVHIMEYFSSGEYAKNMNDKNAVYKGLNQDSVVREAYAKLKDMGKGFMEMGDAVWGAGSSRLRDSGIPALGELADMIKKKGTAVGRDAGFIPAARIARADFMHKLAEGLGPMEETMMRDAMEALQQGKAATTPEGLKAQAAIRGVLDDVFDYLGKAGVKVNDLGYGKDYFPRHWDSNYLSKHKAEFMAMARKYPDWHNPEDTYNKLIANDGAELRVADRPGFSGKKERVLSFIDHADAAPFMSKNLLATVNGYITQATRRAEWARRFNDDNTGIEGLLVRARKEGASEKDIDHAQKFLAGVNGTLGDDLNPTMRRYMGNMIVYQNVRLLPLAIFSSVVDPMGIAVRGGTVGDAFKTFVRGIKEVPAGLKGKQITDHWTQMAEALGTIDNATLSHSLGALYTQGMVDGTARKINDTFFRFNLMEQFNNSMRVGATEASLKFMAKHADGKASMHSARWMNELGLSRGDIKVDKDGHVLTTVADGLTEAQAARVKRAVNQWVDGAVLRPDAADKPTWMNDPHFMLVSHLKQFVYSFQHTILDRVVHEFKNGNYQPAMAMASYIPIMIAADTLKGFIMGGGSQPGWKAGWGVSDYLESGIERAGLFGVGQFGIDALTGHAGTLVGPTLEQFGQAVAAVQGPKQFAPMVIHALPANALYSGYVRGASVPDPVHSE